MTSLYRPILKQAWQITWRHKFLWLFGFFAAWLGTAGEYELILRSFDRIGAKGSLLVNLNEFIITTGVANQAAQQNIKTLLAAHPMAIAPVIIICLVLLLAAAFIIWAVVVSQGGLINSVKQLAKGQAADFQTGLAAGIGKFWPVFWLNLIYRLAVFVLFLGLGVTLGLLFANALTNPAGASVLNYFIIFFIGFVIFIPLVIIASFIARFAICYAVVRNYRLKEAIKQGCFLFFKNWLIGLELAFVLLFLYIAAAVLLTLLSLVIVAPLLFLAAAFYSMQLVWALNLIIILALLVFLAIAIMVTAIFSAYFWSAWTLLFIQLTEKGGASKLIRLTSALPGLKQK